MKRIKLISINEDGAVIDFQADFAADGRGGGYQSHVTLTKDSNGAWTATMTFDGMPPTESPEAAIDKMGQYLATLTKAMKSKHMSHLNVRTLFQSKGFK